tara:strand:- start:1612 stop:1761 length:150 start_codon:yes stop_codon:yes gene_type:complete
MNKEKLLIRQIDKLEKYISKLEDKLIQIKMDYSIDDYSLDIEDLIDNNL